MKDKILARYEWDNVHISKLHCSQNDREWLASQQIEFQDKNSRYDSKAINYLEKNNINFSHYLPFVISGRKYFGKFYLHDKRTVVEFKSESKSSRAKSHYREKCKDFQTFGIKLVTVSKVFKVNEWDSITK